LSERGWGMGSAVGSGIGLGTRSDLRRSEPRRRWRSAHPPPHSRLCLPVDAGHSRADRMASPESRAHTVQVPRRRRRAHTSPSSPSGRPHTRG
jgi:hypothetical protein